MTRLISFKQFITESSWDKLLYHATYRDDIDPKNPPEGIHVGTLHAAMARAHQTHSPDHKGANLKVYAFKYKPAGKSIRVKDEGSEGRTWHMDVQHQLHKKGLMGDMTPKMYDTLRSNTGRALKKHNIGTLSYRNNTEDPGSTSRVIYDTKSLKHVHTFAKPKFIKRNYGGASTPYFSKSKAQRKVK